MYTPSQRTAGLIPGLRCLGGPKQNIYNYLSTKYIDYIRRSITNSDTTSHTHPH